MNLGHTLTMIDIDFDTLRTIGLTQAIAGQLATISNPGTGARLVRITEVQRSTVTVHDGLAVRAARALPALVHSLKDDETALAVGDWVVAEENDHGEYWVSARLAPVNQLARRAGDGRRQVIASNIDTALLVMGLDHDFNLRRLERYLSTVGSAGVSPVIVLTKADTATGTDERIDALRMRVPHKVPVFAVNGLSPETAAMLSPWLGAGQTLILLGSSGAGKSTLTNTLAASQQLTGGVRGGDSRGRHTTTARSLHQCAGGACIIDTPGLRSLQPDAGEDALAATYDDIALLARQCQFRDCRHLDEPGCAVRSGVDSDRLDNYHKLLRDARRLQQTPLDRIAERGKWKVLMKAASERGKRKRS